MNTLSKNFGNIVGLILLATDNTFPALTLWTGVTGNCIKLITQAQGKTKSPLGVTVKDFKTNDDNMYATSEERKYEYMANLFERGKLYTEWINTALVAAKLAGQKVLFVANLGYVTDSAFTGYKEVFAIGEQESSLTEDDNVGDSMLFRFLSTPLGAGSFSLTTTNIATINTALGSGSVKATTAVTIPGGINAKPAVYIYT